jgi:hypothetical protein
LKVFYKQKKLDERREQFERARERVSSLQKNKPKERQTQMATVKFVSNKPMQYLGPKSYNGPRSGQQLESSSNNKSAPVRKIITEDRSKG